MFCHAGDSIVRMPNVEKLVLLAVTGAVPGSNGSERTQTELQRRKERIESKHEALL
jgi:hypothetical protein